MADLTGATAIYALSVSGVFDAPQTLQGYAADDSFMTEAIASAEVLMGVDGKLSGGFVFVPIEQRITLQADSPSVALFDEWWRAQQQGLQTYIANASVTILATGETYTCVRGFLTSYKAAPDVKKLLQPRTFGITWNVVTVAPASIGG